MMPEMPELPKEVTKVCEETLKLQELKKETKEKKFWDVISDLIYGNPGDDLTEEQIKKVIEDIKSGKIIGLNEYLDLFNEGGYVNNPIPSALRVLPRDWALGKKYEQLAEIIRLCMVCELRQQQLSVQFFQQQNQSQGTQQNQVLQSSFSQSEWWLSGLFQWFSSGSLIEKCIAGNNYDEKSKLGDKEK